MSLSKIAFFGHPRVFNAPAEGVTLGIFVTAVSPKSSHALPGGGMSLVIFALVWIPVCD